ncbi:hypothetical protein C8J57DRAFT_1214235 [Mycena rebaudengoi]|nr:hypothetical protein C8J57DRAFT_1214235 [Mycena rebaudengoi]
MLFLALCAYLIYQEGSSVAPCRAGGGLATEGELSRPCRDGVGLRAGSGLLRGAQWAREEAKREGRRPGAYEGGGGRPQAGGWGRRGAYLGSKESRMAQDGNSVGGGRRSGCGNHLSVLSRFRVNSIPVLSTPLPLGQSPSEAGVIHHPRQSHDVYAAFSGDLLKPEHCPQLKDTAQTQHIRHLESLLGLIAYIFQELLHKLDFSLATDRLRYGRAGSFTFWAFLGFYSGSRRFYLTVISLQQSEHIGRIPVLGIGTCLKFASSLQLGYSYMQQGQQYGDVNDLYHAGSNHNPLTLQHKWVHEQNSCFAQHCPRDKRQQITSA